MKILLLGSLALIFVCGPCKAGKNLEWTRAGLECFSFKAMSRVNLKYGSWSIAHGMRHGMSPEAPNICGKVLEKDGAAWIAAK